MAAMHYTVMVERSSVKVFFTILVLQYIFYFLQSEYIKKLQNRKAKNVLNYMYYSEKNHDNITPPKTRQNYVKVHAKKIFSYGFAI